jgi:hypothetical protein
MHVCTPEQALPRCLLTLFRNRQKLALDEQQSKRDTTVRRRQQPATHASWAYLFGGLFST